MWIFDRKLSLVLVYKMKVSAGVPSWSHFEASASFWLGPATSRGQVSNPPAMIIKHLKRIKPLFLRNRILPLGAVIVRRSSDGGCCKMDRKLTLVGLSKHFYSNGPAECETHLFIYPGLRSCSWGQEKSRGRRLKSEIIPPAWCRSCGPVIKTIRIYILESDAPVLKVHSSSESWASSRPHAGKR